MKKKPLFSLDSFVVMTDNTYLGDLADSARARVSDSAWTVDYSFVADADPRAPRYGTLPSGGWRDTSRRIGG